MNLIFMLVLGLALLVAGFIGASIHRYLSRCSPADHEYLLDALILVDCILVVLAIWTLPLWSPAWLR